MDIEEFLDREMLNIKEGPQKVFIKEEPQKHEKTLTQIDEHIKRNELTEAEKIYSELWSKITEEKLTWNENLYASLTEINKRLVNTINNLYLEIKEKISVIDNLTAKVREDLRNRKNQSAVSVYSEIIDIFDRIPNTFLADKRKIHNKILVLYRELRDDIDKEFFQDFNSRISQIDSFIYSAKIELQKNNIQGAIQYYTSCLNLYNTLPNGFLTHKIQLSSKILELYKEIAIILEISNLKLRLKPLDQPSSRTEFIQRKFSAPKPLNEGLIKNK